MVSPAPSSNGCSCEVGRAVKNIRYKKYRSPIKCTLVVTLATIRSSVTANMHLIDERYFLYRYRIVVVCSVNGSLHFVVFSQLPAYIHNSINIHAKP